jgi:hypothetical protein
MYGNGLLEMLPRFQIEQKEERWKEGRKKRRKEGNNTKIFWISYHSVYFQMVQEKFCNIEGLRI